MANLIAILKSARTWAPHLSILRRGKATNPSPTPRHPERTARVDGSAVAISGSSDGKNMGAPSLRGFIAQSWENKNLSFLPKSIPARGPRGQAFVRGVEALLLAVAVCFSVGATDASSRYNNLGHRLMCTCSCAQLLGECNHVGCPASGPMLNELSAAIASGATDDQILSSFSAKYGVTVLAAPPTHGFSLVAWIAPIAVFAAALLGTILLVRHWSVGRTSAFVPQSADPAMTALREKIRRETEASDL